MKPLSLADKRRLLKALTDAFRRQCARELGVAQIVEGEAVECHFHRMIYIGHKADGEPYKVITLNHEATH